MKAFTDRSHFKSDQTFLDQKLEASSIENRTPPIGAPKAAAKL
jgi:hypothetical protein